MHFLREESSMTAEWSVENTQIVCELFAEQVNVGNSPGNYLTPKAFDEVTKQFKMRTRLDCTDTQLKNKWDKLKDEFNIFKKLKFRETGAGWDYVNNTVSQDDEWWKKAKIISQLMVLTIGIPLRACLVPLVRQ
ncbi:L10-interacting MYB domain-containing protein-like [Triticum aestivum]|uniref:L10-interacting MYB domain-containing protein-like n=1 Tax=Triticum aestivum TaxID=4565 RepID=UPI001D02198E|nr:L10-interacting MYB domain-containing protein-like [Triticum aestivum]